MDLAPPFDDDKSRQICVVLFDKQQLMKSSYDETGKLPIPSSRGNHCIFALCHHATNAIHDLTKDWTGTSHLGFTLDWHCDEGCVNASIPHHDPKALNKFQHAKPKSAQHAPQQWSQPVHGQKVQHANTSASPHLDKGGMSKPSPVLFSVMDEQLTQLFSQLSTKS
jgi:hypothetical protein